jgi:enoyl-CoA hydratase/carnithine racemase
VVPDRELPAAVDALLGELRALSPSVLHVTRKTLARLHSPDFLEQLEETERVYLSELMQTHDTQEGVRAFLEKRRPVWKGK